MDMLTDVIILHFVPLNLAQLTIAMFSVDHFANRAQ